MPRTDDSPKYAGLSATAKVVGWVKDNAVARRAGCSEGDEAALLLDRTNFYAEQGGQVGDRGAIITPTGRFDVDDTQKLGDAVLHVGRVVRDTSRAASRRPSKSAATGRTPCATTPRRTCSTGPCARCSASTSTRKARWSMPTRPASTSRMTSRCQPEEIAEVERLVNEKIYADLPVTPMTMPLAEAKKIPGVRAVFGEKYPDPVRVLLIGAERPEDATEETSVEFCGGTHLKHTGQAGFFKIVSQEGGRQGRPPRHRRDGTRGGRDGAAAGALLDDLAAGFNCKPDEIAGRVEALQEEMKKLQTQLRKGAAGDLAGAGDKLLAAAVEADGAKIIVGEMPAGARGTDAATDGPSAAEGRQRRGGDRLDRRRQGGPDGGGHGGSGEEGATPASWSAKWRRWSAARAAAARTWPRPAAKTRRNSARRLQAARKLAAEKLGA